MTNAGELAYLIDITLRVMEKLEVRDKILSSEAGAAEIVSNIVRLCDEQRRHTEMCAIMEGIREALHRK